MVLRKAEQGLGIWCVNLDTLKNVWTNAQQRLSAVIGQSGV